MPTTIRCDSCGVENPSGQRFCSSCGSPLPLVCPSCATPAPASSRFCGSCGTPLTTGVGGDVRGTRPLEERRVATVLFADLSGFTALSGSTDPEDVRALVDRCMTLLGEIVDRFGGHIDKIIGDALLALWGVPIAREDHAERAVRAALEMQSCALRREEEFGGLPLRIGVNTGELMFAPVGPRARREQTVMGDVVNVASRLQTSAPRGGVLVGEETWRATRRAIRYEQVEPFSVKGKEEPLDAWLAIEPVAAIPTERPLSSVAMVGREREIETLSRICQRVVDEERPHFVVILGAPGIGKSRLGRELRVAVEQSGARVLRGRSLPYGESSSYGAFADIVKQVAGIFDTDEPEDASHKLEVCVSSLVDGTRRDQVAAALGVMAGIAPGELENRSVLFDAARVFVEELGAAQPTVLAFEDLHWAEPTLVDLVEHLAGHVRDVPVLILASARPELLDDHPGLGGGLPASTTLALDALPDQAAADLARALLRGHPVSPAVLQRISDAAGGNPLFIEELANSVAEGSTDPADALPTSVISIIAARLDAMPPRERQLLLNAAVIGRTFWHDLLAGLDPDPGLDEALEWLEAREYIRRERGAEVEGDQTYAFRHMSLREVAYNTLPKAERRVRHATVARLAEEMLAGNARSFAGVLAHHWSEAGDTGRAIEYLLEAAEQADQAWAKAEAVRLYSDVLDVLPEGDTRRRSIGLRRGLARTALMHIEMGDVDAPRLGDAAGV